MGKVIKEAVQLIIYPPYFLLLHFYKKTHTISNDSFDINIYSNKPVFNIFVVSAVWPQQRQHRWPCCDSAACDSDVCVTMCVSRNVVLVLMAEKKQNQCGTTALIHIHQGN